MTEQPFWTGRKLLRTGALLPVILTFGWALWGDTQARGWSQLPSGVDTAQAAVAGVTTERSPDWSLAATAGREPESIILPLFLSADSTVATEATGVSVGERDLVESYPDVSWGYGGVAQVWRAQAVTVIDSGRVTSFTTWQPTVADALTEQQIELGDQDKITPSITTSIQTADAATPVVITITRVELATVVVKESIPITTTYKDDPTQEKGVEKVLETGQAGIKALSYQVRRENGVEVKRTLQSTTTERAMTPKVVSRGTKVTVIATGQATWYASARTMAASYNSLPRWTKVRVINTQNNKSVVVTIEGGGVHGATIDLGKDAFSQLGLLSTGRLPVRVEKVYD